MLVVLYLRPLMKAAYLFLMSLCFFLLWGGNNYVCAASRSHHKVSFLPIQNSEEKQHLKKTATIHSDFAVIKSSEASENEAFLLTDENDDESSSFGRKQVLLARYSLLIFYTFVLNRLYCCAKDRLPCCNHLSHLSSCKYLTQRVLRI